MWNAVCLSAYWNELPKALLFGIGFGVPIWTSVAKRPSGLSRKVEAVIAGALGVVFVSLILSFQLFPVPLLTAGFVAGLVFSIMAVRWLQ